MMAAPPPAMASRSPFSLGIASEKSRNGSTVPASVSVGDSVDLNANKGSKGKSFGDDDGQQQLDGSLRMSSASTDTTAATTLLLEENSVEDGRVTPPRHALTDAADQKHNLSPQGLQVEVSPQVKAKEVLEIQAGVVPSILQLPPELRDSSRSLNSSRRSRSSRTSAASASGKSKDKQTTTLKQPPASASASASVHRELKQPPATTAATNMLSPVQVVTLDYHDSCSSNMSMAADLVLGTSPASPIVVPSVARMPERNEPEIDPQVLKFVQQLDEAETRKADPLSASDHEKKPPAKETPPTRHGNRKMPARPSLVLANKGRRSPSRSPRPSVTFAALPPETGMIPSLDLDDENDNNTSLQDQSNKPAAKPDTTGNGVPPAIAKPNPSRTCSDPTGSVVPQPRGRGLRGRRQPQTAQDRDNRRRQILERTANNNHNNNNNQQQPPMMSNSDHSIPNSSISSGNSPMPTRTVLLEPGLSPATRTNNRSPTTRSPGTPSSNGTMTRDRPGDSLSLPLQPSTTYSAAAVVPGDNLAAFPAATRPTTRRVVRPLTPHQENKVANPSPNAYAAASPDANDAASVGTACTDLSSKQRARREQGNMPASIRPGAYKEIPGRGLVRNDTLRFSIMSTIQRQKRSLRRMFSSRRNTIATSSRSNNLMDASNQTDSGMRRGNNNHPTSNENNSDPNMLATSASDIGGDVSYTNLFQRSNSMRSIPSVLVSDEGGHDSRSYLGNVSFRSLTDAQEGGLMVARPVFHREPSTLEALCIIPGDLAMTVALDEQIKEAEQSNADARLEALSSGAVFVGAQKKSSSTTTNAMTSSGSGKRTKARRMVQQVVEKPKQLAKSVLKLNPKKLKNPFRRNRIKRSRTSGGANSSEMTDMRMRASEMSAGGGAVRRHSF